jgi:hypothetical protein
MRFGVFVCHIPCVELACAQTVSVFRKFCVPPLDIPIYDKGFYIIRFDIFDISLIDSRLKDL